jgi:hypothetical protein
MARNGRTGMSPLACFQSRRHVCKGHTLRSTVSLSYLQGRLIWCLSWDRISSDSSVTDPQVDQMH